MGFAALNPSYVLHRRSGVPVFANAGGALAVIGVVSWSTGRRTPTAAAGSPA